MIEVKHLTKKYTSGVAVNDLSFTVEPGRIYGFLGPNGAGKSTTMNIITGCLAATEGTVTVNGYDIFEEPREAKRFIGYLPEQPPVYTDSTPQEYLMFVGRAKGLRGAELREQVESVMEDTCIGAVRDRLIKNLSKGYKQRVGIAQAMLGNPEIIILDEPTVGLDPKQIIYIRSLIKKLGEKHTVILSSHILSEISAVCDYVMIISHGQLVASDTLENLSSSLENGNITEMTVRAEKSQVEALLSGIDGIEEYDISDGVREGTLEIRITADPEKNIGDGLFLAFADARIPVYKLEPKTMTLEDMFLKLTADQDPVFDESEYDNGEIDEADGDDSGVSAEETDADDSESDDTDITDNSDEDKQDSGEPADGDDSGDGSDDGDGYTPMFS